MIKNNKISLLAIVVLMNMMTNTAHALAASDQTTVTITGKVLDNTCTLTGAGENITFPLPFVSVRDFNTENKKIGSVEIPIVFTDCGSGIQGVTVKVSGEPGGSAGAFKNTLDGDTSHDGATGVGVNFYDTDGTLIKAGSDVEATKQSFSQDTTLYYEASYAKVADDIKAGLINAVITLSFTYI
jgi:major type 1 subunit fimbrin (pilin)